MEHESSASSESVRGACLCGAVQFTLDLPFRFCVHCHCGWCRRAHGAPLVTWVGLPNEGLHFTSGEDALTHYESSPGVRRSFCKTCGTTLFYASTRWPDEVHTVPGNFLDPLPMAPSAHVNYSSRVDWLHLADDLPHRG